MITAIVGGFLGVSGIRFWWQGLAALLVFALVLPIINTSVAVYFDPQDAELLDMHPASLAGVSAFQFTLLLIWYGVGAGVHWLFTRRKVRDEEAEQRGGR